MTFEMRKNKFKKNNSEIFYGVDNNQIIIIVD